MSESKTKQTITLLTIIVLMVGIIGVLTSAYFAESMNPAPGSFRSAFATALTTISIALFGFGLFSFALDTKNWREYFSERLKEIVVERKYLESLDQDTLKDLQTNVLKAQFKDQTIDKEGSFLNYFHLHLHKHISEPYREDVSTEVLMSFEQGRNDAFLVTDKVRYVCRASGGKIQEHVGWKPDEGEFEEVKSLTISIQFPQSHEKSGEVIRIYPPDGDAEIDLTKGAKATLAEYSNIDGLVVITKAVYIAKLGQFQHWQMAHPTKSFDITIVYPSGCGMQFKTLVLEDVVSQITKYDGYLKFTYGSWALPQSGLAWLITKT
ncbi:hypothetical protein [Mariprofundus ferrooxydans]|nr:hypothetical protein [Mariprofundus ferrooxydans]